MIQATPATNTLTESIYLVDTQYEECYKTSPFHLSWVQHPRVRISTPHIQHTAEHHRSTTVEQYQHENCVNASARAHPEQVPDADTSTVTLVLALGPSLVLLPPDR